jgi:protein-tyrosine phosphatase
MRGVSTYRVIFVCMGNICRSPMAEMVLRHQLAMRGLADQVTVDSAGTGGWHIGDPADRRARAALERRGYASSHSARQFDPQWFADRDLVVALDHENLRDLKRLAPTRDQASAVRRLREFDPDAEAVDVDDPYYGDAAGFEDALDQIESACDGLVDHLAETLGAAQHRPA